MLPYLAFWFAILFDVAVGHYVFNKLRIDGVEGEEYQYIRKNSNGIHPVKGLDNVALRCNVDGHVGGETETARVEAGSNVTWVVDPYVYHPGPVSVYMTKVPDASKASGSTEWFKILDIGPKFSKRGGDWKPTQQPHFDVTIPQCLAAGEYLMRMQQIGVHLPGGEPQFHVSCAQLKVLGGGTELPSQKYLVRIPGAFSREDPGFNQNIFVNFREYKAPGGEVWSC